MPDACLLKLRKKYREQKPPIIYTCYMKYSILIIIGLLSLLLMGCDELQDNPDEQLENSIAQSFAYPSLEKQNHLIVGANNPVRINADGVPDSLLLVSALNINLSKTGAYTYNATTTETGVAEIIVDAPGFEMPLKYEFGVKTAPTPFAALNGRLGGSMPNGEFRAQTALGTVFKNFDFDVDCEVVGFEMVYVARRQDPVPVVNVGAQFTDRTAQLTQQAKPGDIYYFHNVKVRCPGDQSNRSVNSLVFNIR